MSEVVPSTKDEAHRRADRIRGHVASAWEEVITAYKHRDHESLGYGTGQAGWDAYILGEYGESRLALPRAERVQHVVQASSAGLSNRAIASASGVTEGTVRNDLRDNQVRKNYAPTPEHRTATFQSGGGFPDADDVTPERNVTGVDGKTYTVNNRPMNDPTNPAGADTPKRRRAITDQAAEIGWEVRKEADKLLKLLEDDRFTRNKTEVTAHLRGHLLHMMTACNAVLDA